MPVGTTFHLIRHASYDLLGRALAGRSPGHSLNSKGRTEGVRVAEGLSGHPILAIIASPTERAQETAVIIAARLSLTVEIEQDLDEIDFGDWTGLEFADLHSWREWQTFNRFRSAGQIPGGETMLQAQVRAVTAVMRLRTRWPDGELVLVTHGDIVKALLAYFLGAPLDLFQRIEIAPASRSMIWLGEEGVRIDGINLPAGS